MNLFLKSPARVLAMTLAVAGLMLPVVASAQPSYAQPSNASSDETIQGRIASIDGTFNLSLSDDRGFVDSIELHQGTIINPTGLTLAAGMSVTITGYAEGSVFEANEIDTPYDYSGPAPVPTYYGDGWWYPGYEYGYGPSFLLSLNFFGGGYHFEHQRFTGRPWDGRGFFSGRIYVQGPRVIFNERRSFVAPRNDSRFVAPRDSRYVAPRNDVRTVQQRNDTRFDSRSGYSTTRTAPQSSYRSTTTTRTYQTTRGNSGNSGNTGSRGSAPRNDSGSRSSSSSHGSSSSSSSSSHVDKHHS